MSVPRMVQMPRLVAKITMGARLLSSALGVGAGGGGRGKRRQWVSGS